MYMRRITELVICLLAFWLTPLSEARVSSSSVVQQAAGADHKRVLILYAYNNNVPALQQIAAGISGVINSNSLQSADFVHEYLDITPPKFPAQRSKLGELLLQKYAGQQFDLIVAYSTEALSFLLDEGKELSLGSPCLAMFAAVNQEFSQTERVVTHIPVELDPRGTLELGLALFPNTHRVLFISGVAAVDKVFESNARIGFASWQGKLEFEYTSQRPVAELMKDVVQLPPNTLVIFSNVATDITGKGFVPRDLVKTLASISNAPVLSMISTQIDTGVLGGSMINMELIGAMIANSIEGLESGKPLTIEPASSFIRPMFNWTQIQRWGVDPNRLPPESIFVNRPLTLWGQYKAEVVTAIVLILILSAMTVALVIQNRKRKFAEMSVREAAALLAAERDLLDARVVERTVLLSEALEFNETMLHNSPVPMSVYAESGQCIMANEAHAKFVGATREALLARNFYDISSWRTTSLLGDCLAALKLHTAQQREAHLHTSFGKDVWFEYQIIPVHLKGQSHLLIQFFDLTERKRVEEELRHLAFHDSLTRLPNRRLLLDRLMQALYLAKRENSYLAVLFVDLDRFKQLNDSYGHDTGDQMLIEVANRLQMNVRKSDTVARLGGDEFIVLLAGLSTDFERAAQYAESVAEKIRNALSAEYVLDKIHHQGSASVGVKLVLGGDIDPDQILKDADSAMYEIKKGRGC